MPKPKKKIAINKTNPEKQIGFFANLPVSTVCEIRRRSSVSNPQWMVIRDAINATKPYTAGKKQPSAKKRAAR